MKTLFLFLAFVCVISLSAQSFPQKSDNPRWEFSYWDGSNPLYGDTKDTYHLGDAVCFNDKQWIQILRNTSYEEYTDIDSSLAGYYRVEGMQVYFSRYGTDEGLLYDFSLNAGDTVSCLSPFNTETITYRVLGVDTLHCNGATYRRLNVECQEFWPPYGFNFHNTYWIEGFGDRAHPFPPLFCFAYFCPIVHISNILYLPSVHIDGYEEIPCPVVTSVSDLAQELSFSLFPNPISTANQELFISGLKQQQTYEISLINMTGQHISHWDISPSFDPFAINLPELTTGMYWLHIRDRNHNTEILPLMIE